MDSLDILMKLIVVESDFLGPNVKEPFFANLSFRELLKNLLVTGKSTEINAEDGTIDNFLILEFQESYYNKFWDTRFFFYNELKSILEEDQFNPESDSESTTTTTTTKLSLSQQQLFYSNHTTSTITKHKTVQLQL
ncbi:unnamed protein product [Ambrosiozyma monospora]|uniref:Unnamed protein product n=1 Tax=Ambrosiozyma monospora TaxID=43982 RepID=A0ACB5U1D2_AMBMO|nr:unnamed protein product [Ambrosiozyma monospora]